jgi:D-beta-D-heptose 7-phosphate kinase/D-beta-D-heptose 1-phosphate adenosyltransferase
MGRSWQSKTVYSREALAALLLPFPQNEKGFTSGTFDILHWGHLSYLQECKDFCKILIVGVNSDSSVRTYKSPHRPILPQQERLALIAALECVDYAFLFEEQNNHQNIHCLQPGWYFKAGDYQLHQLSSKPLVEHYGGKVQLLPLLPNRSTSQILQAIQTGSPLLPSLPPLKKGT